MAFEFLKNIFGKKKSSGLPKELEAYMGQIQNEVFPGGTEQQMEELVEAAKLIGVHPKQIYGTFAYACTRMYIGNCDKDTLITGIARHKDGLSDIQIEKLAKYVVIKFIKQKMGLDDKHAIEMTLNCMGFLSDDHGGMKYDKIPGGYGEFGISINNPVPVNGIPSNEKYLRRLQTADGLNISWTRLGSGGADNISDPIDIYNIKDENGNKRDTIYISPYHPCTSNKAPKGYKFK